MRGRGALRGRSARLFFFGLLVLSSRPAAAAEPLAALIARSRALGLAQDRAWLALGHYRPRRFGGWESQADGPEFFLAPGGKRDPAAELEASLAAFFEPEPVGDRAQHAVCRFPARHAWLSERLGFDAARRCPRFEEWRDSIAAGGVTLVFADAFLNNPASMYGHTFLRLRRRGSAAGEDLLDYTVNFAGTTGEENALFYALKGVFGAYPGKYSTMPYYMKITEYNDIESRDLWEYDLAFDQKKVDALIRHAWEMGSTDFDYYFFSENCSYQLLTLLDAANPSLGLADGFGFPAIPMDTLRAVLDKPGLVTARRYRPSQTAKMLWRRSRLTPAEARAAKTGAPDPAWPAERRALVLDSAQDYLLYKQGARETVSAEERALLLARGRLGVASPPDAVPVPAAPESAHASARVGLGGGVDERAGFQELWWRGALHDFADASEGYRPGGELEMVDLKLRFDDRERELFIERLDLVRIASLQPWDPWVRKPSWKVSAGVDQAKERGCAGADCMYVGLDVGTGLSAETRLGRRELYYAFAEVDGGLGAPLVRGRRVGAGGSAGLILEPWAWWRVSAEATYIAYESGPTRERLKVVSAWDLRRGLQLRLTLDRRTPAKEAGLALLWHY